jgi:molybdopterin synthase catalytic subunit
VAYLTTAPLDLGRLVARVSAPARGGIACFLGVVRDHHGGRAVESLDYSAYEPMAEAECARVVAEARARWQAEVTLEHRLGHLEVGDAAVAIAAAAPHRDAAFAACRYVIEEVKRRVPIWKRERYADGTEAWVDPTAGKSRGAEEQKSSEPVKPAEVEPAGSSDWAV